MTTRQQPLSEGGPLARRYPPAIGPFVTVLRLAGRDPVPPWQIAAAIGVGVVTVVLAVWAAAKVFRVGVLMYGKPPTIRNLVRWLLAHRPI